MSISRTRPAGGHGLRSVADLWHTSRPTNRSAPRLEVLESRTLLATIVVNTYQDENDPSNGTLSLREAIEVSNGTLDVASLSPAAQAQVIGGLSAPAPNRIVFALQKQLVLLPSLPDVGAIPTTGTNQVIVAQVADPATGFDALYIRVFDTQGQMVVDTNEYNLANKPGPLTTLKGSLLLRFPPHVLSPAERDLILLAVAGLIDNALVERISLTAPLPPLAAPVAITGENLLGAAYNSPNQPDVDTATVNVWVDGYAASQAAPGSSINGFDVVAPNCTLSSLIITGFSGAGVSISNLGTQGSFLYGNFIGVLPQPTTGRDFIIDPTLGNGVAGVKITSSNNRIGGNNPGLRNVIAGNGVGVILTGTGGTGSLIQNNFILANAQQGVYVASSNNTIGEALKGGGNVISGNGAQGVLITGGPDVQGNNVLGNEIGTDLGTVNSVIPRGLNALPNRLQGVLIQDSPKNTVGGYLPDAKNVIAGNLGDGLAILGDAASNNRVLGNWIGFNIVAGRESLFIPNRNGITITSAGNVIGGSIAGATNTIDNNRLHGIYLSGAGATGNVIQGNVIGLNPDGGSAFGNAFDGIHLDDAPNNTIGGTSPAARNTISANNNGVVLNGAGSTGNIVQGNFIGTAVDGVTDLGNAVNGVSVVGGPLNTIGGTAPGAGNVISGNNRGVVVTGPNALNTLIQGNFIGTDLTGVYVINNEIDGVLITGGAAATTVGGPLAGAGNTIAFNAGSGVNVDSGLSTLIQANSVHDNHALGIVLNGAAGANNGQPAPTVVAAAPTINGSNVQGTLDAAPLTTYVVEFFSSPAKDPSGFGQGQTFLGRGSVTTDVTGHADFAIDVPAFITSGQWVTATATDPNSNTSAFSNAVLAVPVQVQLAVTSAQANETDGTIALTVTRSGGVGGSVSVGYSTTAGTAVPGVDYSDVSGTITFNPGDPLSKTISVPILNPHKVGGSGTFVLTLSNPANGATLGATTSTTVTILYNELPSLLIASAGYTAKESAGSVEVTITRNSPVGTATVSYATADGTAVAGVNYTSTSGTLTFNPGDLSKTITIPVLGDNAVTGDLDFSLNLSSPTGAIVGTPGSTTVTLTNADAAGSLQFNSGVYNAAAGLPNAAITVTRQGGKAGTVTVAYTTGGGTAVPGLDYTPVSGTLTFGPGETSKVILVPLLRNSTPGPVTSFGLTLSAPGGGATLGKTTQETVNVRRPTSGSGGGSTETVPPTVVGFQPVAGPNGITAAVITFSEAMDPTRASNKGNYGYFATSPGRDGRYGTFDDTYTLIASANYNASTRTAVITFASPLNLGSFYQVVLDRDAAPGTPRGLTDLAGNLLDGTGTGRSAGTPYVTTFGEGRALSYVDSAGRTVSLSLSGPGLMTVRRGADGNALTVDLGSTTAGVTALNGTVTRPRNVTGPAVIPVIKGASGVKVNLKSPNFVVGTVSASAVDRLSALPRARRNRLGQSSHAV
ncbi:MAG: Calx-beta domain-containing protein [Isosphaeraceae bacterium]